MPDDPDVIKVVKEDGTVVEMSISQPNPTIPKSMPPPAPAPASTALVPAQENKPVEKTRKKGGKGRKKDTIDRQDYSDRINKRMGLSGDKEIDFSDMKAMQLIRFHEMLTDPTMLIEILQNLAKAATPDQIVGILHEGKETVKTLNEARRILTASDPEAQKSMFPLLKFGLNKFFGGKKDDDDEKDGKK